MNPESNSKWAHRCLILCIAILVLCASTSLSGEAFAYTDPDAANSAQHPLATQQVQDTGDTTGTVNVTNNNTNTNVNHLNNTNVNQNNNTATANATASQPGENGANGCTLPSPGAPFEELQKLLADDGAEGDFFGTSVAVDRATETIVVGAPGDTNENGEGAGAVYVFTCQGDQFVRTQKLLASDGAANDSFGESVAIDGDSIVVGAPFDTNENGEDAGAAYVFERQGDQFAETQKLIASDGEEFDHFGESVAIDGDTIVVGAPFDTNENGFRAGAAYVFERQGGQFVETQKLIASDPSESGAFPDEFGGSVAIDDGVIVVGAQFDNNDNGQLAGAAYVFERQGGQFVETQKLIASDGDQRDNFGRSVAIDGDTIVVGAIFAANESGVDTGAAYVFERQGGQFVETQKLTSSDGDDFDRFGDSVAIDGDTIVVGAPGDTNENGVDAGAAYVLERQGGQFVETQKLIASDPSGSPFGDEFGSSVAIDGYIVTGAPGDDNVNGEDAGAAYVYI